MIGRYNWLFVMLLLLMTSCDRTMVYNHFDHIDNGSWHWDNPVDFSFEIDDTSSLHNILIQLRHSIDYPVSNLYLFVHVEGPTGQQMTDTINFLLAEPSGKWLGKGGGKQRQIAYMYRRNTVFPLKGIYNISLEQAMRAPELPVNEVGIRVERVNP